MAVTGPVVICHKCGAKLTLRGDGKLPVHYARWTNVTCIGSLEKPR
jgi:hypothetical protein